MIKQFSPNEYKPTGWLRRQLEIQANGLSGHLDKMWGDIKDSAWIGGTKEGWERLPYWLDGFIPLAYILEDDDMISRANRYVSAILDRAKPSGWICPVDESEAGTYDLWAVFLIGKVLALYCDFTNDARAEKILLKSMKNLYVHLKNGVTLHEWGRARWFEAMIPLYHLKKKHHRDSWIPELAVILREQGLKWTELKERWITPLDVWTFETHIVNIGMMFKCEEYYCAVTGEKSTGEAEKMWEHLTKYNGTCVGTFTGDECLAGLANNHGTELCAVVELMYTCEELYRITKNPVWLDRLEKASFNALPATFTDDMWAHQYDQLVNQIECVRFKTRPHFSTNGVDADLFGIEPNYGCCTANLSQGYPKLAMNVFLRDKSDIICAMMLPSELNTKIGGNGIKISIDTNYPFRMSGKYTVSVSAPTEFRLKIRIPSWAKSVMVNGEKYPKNKFIVIDRVWDNTEEITVEFGDKPHFVSRPYGMYAVEYGALVFALPVESEPNGIYHEAYVEEYADKYVDWEFIPKSEWRYAFDKNTSLEVTEKKGCDVPFSSVNPSVTIRASVHPVEWEYLRGTDCVSAVCPVSSKATGESVVKELYPYGATILRVTEMAK